MPSIVKKTLRKLRRKRHQSQEPLLQPHLNIKILLLTWEEDQDKPFYARRLDSKTKVNKFLSNYPVVRYRIPTRTDPNEMLKETAEFIKQCEKDLEPHSCFVLCYAGRHAHYTHGYDLQPMRYNPDAFHWNGVMRALDTMSLDATILNGPVAAQVTGLETVLEYEDRVSSRVYRKKKYAHRDILCLGALNKTSLSADLEEFYPLRHVI